MSNQLETPTPIAEYEAKLRAELLPINVVEDFFVHQIASNTVLSGFLVRNILADPEMTDPQTPRRIRLLQTYQRQSRYCFEELRRHQLARQLQQRDPALAAETIDTIIATHTTRDGLRAKPRPLPFLNAPAPIPQTPITQSPATQAPTTQTPVTKPAAPGRNAPCPCNSGRKYKHCCLNNPRLPQAA